MALSFSQAGQFIGLTLKSGRCWACEGMAAMGALLFLMEEGDAYQAS